MNTKTPKAKKSKAAVKPSLPEDRLLLTDVREMIIRARENVAQASNAWLTLLYWQVGDRIRREILKEQHAAYGAEILQTLSAKLIVEFCCGFSQRNLASMVRFAEVFPGPKIVSAVRRQLT